MEADKLQRWIVIVLKPVSIILTLTSIPETGVDKLEANHAKVAVKTDNKENNPIAVATIMLFVALFNNLFFIK